MNNRRFHKEHLFIPAMIVSVAVHGAFIGASGWMPNNPQFFVLSAPNTLEVTVINQPLVSVLQEEIVTKEIIQADDKLIFTHSRQNQSKDNSDFSTSLGKLRFNPDQPKTGASQKVQGALSEARPNMNVNLAPSYPQLARNRGWEGIVKLEVLVDRQGNPKQVDVIKSSGHNILDKKALKTVKNWKFTPAKTGNISFSSTITIPIQFSLIAGKEY